MNSLPYTREYDLHEGIISTTCKISAAFDPSLEQDGIHPPFVECNAIWDTGAMRSVISHDLAQKIGLLPIGKTRVFHVKGESLQNTYLLNILLPNKIEIQSIIVTDGYFTDTDFLIGMDVISLCDIAITSSQGKLKFSFQIPSIYDIDFTKFH